MLNELKSSGFAGRILQNEPLKNHTTMKVGGNAELFVLPENEESLLLAVECARKNQKKFYILGGGSNIVFKDTGFDGLIICTENLNKIEKIEAIDENKLPIVNLICQAGKPTSEITDYCLQNNIQGFECFSGLPGTVGGACFMNARCYDDELSNHIKSVTYLDLDEMKIKEYEFDKSDWAYKISPFQKGNNVILKVVLHGLKQLTNDSSEMLSAKAVAQRCYSNREEKGHFKYPSSGSVFKNNRSFGKPSGVLVDEAGLKGLSVGGAQVAPWHGNFIINNGAATADDIKELVEKIQSIVKEKTGFMLEPEVIFL
ncbi:MAG: UDP-N-acetylmuramate dehydrogenase [Treponema sp.]|nr:UDP-N-acetylmuramate dehydrogenase [Candidatus Treponema equifaecale]